ncbi:hypothetical protein BYT27DRAFT_7260822 [Phlegmacium glaucopus]|nr:hypothetical protein BYT27DRAFT_7260822 [Phlegmacium glaucopus]
MGRRVIAIDTGEAKSKLCDALGADHRIDFAESECIVADMKKATDGRAVHAAIIPAEAVFSLHHSIASLPIALETKIKRDNRQDAIEAIETADIVKCCVVAR